LSFDSHRLRDALGQFATGIIVLTGQTDSGVRIGMTMNSFNSVSLDPPLVLFSIRRNSSSLAEWRQCARYGINVLREEQEGLSNRFAGGQTAKWDNLIVPASQTGVPIFPDALVTFECETYARYDGGDHEIFVARVIALHDNKAEQGRPILFFRGKYRQLANIGAPHEPPSEIYGW
jgi:flavin reductase (DIM6/NTAB) family NADH-FMN oxidoreductase RutF